MFITLVRISDWLKWKVKEIYQKIDFKEGFRITKKLINTNSKLALIENWRDIITLKILNQKMNYRLIRRKMITDIKWNIENKLEEKYVENSKCYTWTLKIGWNNRFVPIISFYYQQTNEATDQIKEVNEPNSLHNWLDTCERQENQ